MEEKKIQTVRHRHTFDLGGNLTYALVVLGIVGFLFAMSYFHLWETISK